MSYKKWVFFDIGSTLVDESGVYENRIKEITQNNNIDTIEFITKVKQRAQTEQKPIVSVAENYGVKVPEWRHDLGLRRILCWMNDSAI